MTEQGLSSPTPSERATALVPYRFTIYFCGVAEDQDEAVLMYDTVTDWIERCGGLPEGGSVEKMDAADVVEDSPLALLLRGVSSPPHPAGAAALYFARVYPCPDCGSTDGTSFDRTLCACGMMHNYCVGCGRQADPCWDEPRAEMPPASQRTQDGAP